MTDTSKEAAWDALMNYQQADEEGIMVLVSRQAIHECKDERDALRAQLQAARDEALEDAIDAVVKNAPRFDPEGPATSEEYGESEGFRIAIQTIRALKSTSAEGEG